MRRTGLGALGQRSRELTPALVLSISVLAALASTPLAFASRERWHEPLGFIPPRGGLPATEGDFPGARVPPAGGLDVTFLVAGDLHFGWGNVEASTADFGHQPAPIEAVHGRQLEDMLGMAGTPYPAALGGRVAEPRGLLIAGDLTERGTRADWRKFLRYYGPGGRRQQLDIPVFEGIGNHDERSGDFIAHQVAARHGSEVYSWNWEDLHAVCLGIAPNDRVLGWLAQDLAEVGTERPIVLFQHYPLAGLYSDTWFVRGGFRARLRDVLHGYNVIGIFHGHLHATGTYVWEGMDVYFVGSAKDAWRSFAVVRVTDRELTVASWNYDLHGWWWWHRKGIDGGDRFPILDQNPSARLGLFPLVPQAIE